MPLRSVRSRDLNAPFDMRHSAKFISAHVSSSRGSKSHMPSRYHTVMRAMLHGVLLWCCGGLRCSCESAGRWKPVSSSGWLGHRPSESNLQISLSAGRRACKPAAKPARPGVILLHVVVLWPGRTSLRLRPPEVPHGLSTAKRCMWSKFYRPRGASLASTGGCSHPTSRLGHSVHPQSPR